MPIDLSRYEAWFVTGSQHLYGEDVLGAVAKHGEEIARTLDQSHDIPIRVVCKPVMTTPEVIAQLCRDASANPQCVGLIAWMHTFSPARMWIGGLKALQRPLLHLHTQFNRDIPWDTIDMDFMNLNQSAHGDREFGFICTRLGLERKVVVGHFRDAGVHRRVGVWARAACAWLDGQGAKFVRFGDNMRQVAVTEGDKVEGEIRFGYAVNGWGVGDLVESIQAVADGDIDRLIHEYQERYLTPPPLRPGGERHGALREAARIERGLRAFLEAGDFKGFTTTFENLHGLAQLPGLAVQRLMADGYGFGAEGDWKTAALVRAVKVMSSGLPGGASFMEDYMYHFEPSDMKVLGAHMLEVCESIADGQPKLVIAPLSIGGKSDPPRLVFDVAPGPALNATIVDLGDRFRLIVNEIEVIAPDAPLRKLAVARAVWRPKPDLQTAAAAWILAGGAHHVVFTKAIDTEYLVDFADIALIELLTIDAQTQLPSFKKEMRWNRASYSTDK